MVDRKERVGILFRDRQRCAGGDANSGDAVLYLDQLASERVVSHRMLKNAPACAVASAGRQLQRLAKRKDEGWRRDE